MKYIGLSIGDPWDNANWSSNPLYFFKALKKHGLADAYGVHDNLIGYNFNNFFYLLKHRDRNLSNLIASRSSMRGRQLALKANKILDSLQNIDAIISTTTHIDFKTLNKPVFNIMDATWDLLAKRTHLVYNPQWKREPDRIDMYEREQLHKAKGILAFSQWVKDSCVNHYGIPEEKVLVCGHGHNLPEISDFNKAEVEEPYILFVSTDFERKGGPVAINSFKKVQKVLPNIKLKIVGRAPMNAVMNIHNVEYLGFINKNEPAGLIKFIDIYKKAAVMILPTIYDPSPNITLEAMYCKTPVVASDVDGIPEQIINGYNGYVIKNFNSQDYAEKIIDILKNDKKRLQMSENARKMVSENFNWDTIAKKINKNIIESLATK